MHPLSLMGPEALEQLALHVETSRSLPQPLTNAILREEVFRLRHIVWQCKRGVLDAATPAVAAQLADLRACHLLAMLLDNSLVPPPVTAVAVRQLAASVRRLVKACLITVLECTDWMATSACTAYTPLHVFGLRLRMQCDALCRASPMVTVWCVYVHHRREHPLLQNHRSVKNLPQSFGVGLAILRII